MHLYYLEIKSFLSFCLLLPWSGWTDVGHPSSDITITILFFFLGLQFVGGKGSNKPNLILLLLIFGIFHASGSFPCWDGTNSWEDLDFTPKSDSAFPVPDQTAAAFCASSVSSPKPTSRPQQPAKAKQWKFLIKK